MAQSLILFILVLGWHFEVCQKVPRNLVDFADSVEAELFVRDVESVGDGLILLAKHAHREALFLD